MMSDYKYKFHLDIICILSRSINLTTIVVFIQHDVSEYKLLISTTSFIAT